jgi:elongation factor P
MITAKQMQRGAFVKYNGQLCEVVEAEFFKPTKGGAIIRSKFRNLLTGNVFPDTLRAEDVLEDIHVDQKELQYLYRDDMGYCFMDEKSYEQHHISEEKLGDAKDYLKENCVFIANLYDGEIIKIAPPIFVILKIVETEPGLRGNTVSGGSKPATLETGKIIKVPLFVDNGVVVKVDTRTGDYVERA